MAMPNKTDPFPELSRAVTLPEKSQSSDGGDAGGRRRRRAR
jgi:uncharacterized 2Fe-2S/4Fe-4S cluster protein (DUF4445 family)